MRREGRFVGRLVRKSAEDERRKAGCLIKVVLFVWSSSVQLASWENRKRTG